MRGTFRRAAHLLLQGENHEQNTEILVDHTQRQLRDFDIDEDRLQHAALSPNGDWLAITRTEEDGETTVWAIGYKNDERIFLGKGANAVWSPDGEHLIYNTNGRPQLVLVDQKFYQIHLNLPPGSQVIASSTWPE